MKVMAKFIEFRNGISAPRSYAYDALSGDLLLSSWIELSLDCGPIYIMM